MLIFTVLTILYILAETQAFVCLRRVCSYYKVNVPLKLARTRGQTRTIGQGGSAEFSYV